MLLQETKENFSSRKDPKISVVNKGGGGGGREGFTFLDVQPKFLNPINNLLS